MGILTLGIYTPMHIRVTCAQAAAASTRAGLSVPTDADEGAVRAAFGSAADLAAQGDYAVLVRFDR